LPDNRVRARWEAGEPAIAAWMNSDSTLIAQILGGSGVDAVVVDLQHGSASLDGIFDLLAAIELRGAEPFVRVPSLDAGLIGRCLDAGATGIIAPLIDTAAEASALVSAIRYPPFGRRSYGPRVPSLRYGPRYVGTAAASVIGLAMIETVAGLAAVEEIASTEGLDGLFIGPADLSISLGFGPPSGERPEPVAAAVERIRTSAHATGRRVGIFCAQTADAQQAFAGGFDLLTTTPDVTLVADGTRRTLSALR
jgi:4-hydroxy-2-oxoheptanedioate aldolase